MKTFVVVRNPARSAPIRDSKSRILDYIHVMRKFNDSKAWLSTNKSHFLIIGRKICWKLDTILSFNIRTLKILQSSSFQLFFPACFHGIRNIVLFSSSHLNPGICPLSIISISQYRSLFGGSDFPLDEDWGDGTAICTGGGGDENVEVDEAGDMLGIPIGDPGVPNPIPFLSPLWCKNGELACSKWCIWYGSGAKLPTRFAFMSIVFMSLQTTNRNQESSEFCKETMSKQTITFYLFYKDKSIQIQSAKN